MIYIYPYSSASKSAKDLAKQLGAKRIKLKNSKFKWSPKKTVINWGHSSPPFECINKNTKNAIDKLKAFKLLAEHKVSIPKFTEDHNEAMAWVKKGRTVFARKTTTGKEGKGIVVLNDFPDTKTPLYTQYVNKKQEFRVHVFNGAVISVREKLLKKGLQPSRIRNTNNGYVFGHARNLTEAKQTCLHVQAVEAVKALGLDFGAVDIIWNDHYGRAYVLEVNTAPGLSEVGIELYGKAINGN